jgi:hypothetical protein
MPSSDKMKDATNRAKDVMSKQKGQLEKDARKAEIRGNIAKAPKHEHHRAHKPPGA